jgi:hypothetical protein
MMCFVLGYSSHRAMRILGAAAVGVVYGLLLALAVPAVAGAATFAWSGGAAKGSPDWSGDANWLGGLAPSAPGPVTLAFPRLVVHP